MKQDQRRDNFATSSALVIPQLPIKGIYGAWLGFAWQINCRDRSVLAETERGGFEIGNLDLNASNFLSAVSAESLT